MSPSPTTAKSSVPHRREKRRRREPLPDGVLWRSPITKPAYRQGQKPANAGKRYPAEVLSRAEFVAVLEALPVTGPHFRSGTRDRALWALLCRSGVRIAEALDLELKDLDLRAGFARVLHGKGDQARVVPIDDFTGQHLVDWLLLREQILTGESQGRNVTQRATWRGPWPGSGPDHGPVFCVTKGITTGRPIGDSCVREAFKTAAEHARIRRRVHPHGARHHVASEWLMEGAPLPLIQDLLGHASVRTTELYANKLRGPQQMLAFAHGRARPDNG